MLLDEWGLAQHNLLMLCRNSPLAVGADGPLPEHTL